MCLFYSLYHFLSLAVNHCHLLSLVVPLVVTRCHSLSFAVTRCHSLSLVIPVVVICCHSLSFVVTRCTTRCHLLSLVVTQCTSRLSFYERCVNNRPCLSKHYLSLFFFIYLPVRLRST